MTDKLQTILDALKKAILAEMEGMHFYKNAAAGTSDFQAKDIFSRLEEEEQKHVYFLTRHYKALSTTGMPDIHLLLDQKPAVESGSPIFSEALRGRIKDAHFEMSALSIAVQLEKNGMEFYRSQAGLTEVPEIKKLFNFLADWETEHYRALNSQLEAVREEYWNKNFFSPM